MLQDEAFTPITPTRIGAAPPATPTKSAASPTAFVHHLTPATPLRNGVGADEYPETPATPRTPKGRERLTRREEVDQDSSWRDEDPYKFMEGNPNRISTMSTASNVSEGALFSIYSMYGVSVRDSTSVMGSVFDGSEASGSVRDSVSTIRGPASVDYSQQRPNHLSISSYPPSDVDSSNFQSFLPLGIDVETANAQPFGRTAEAYNRDSTASDSTASSYDVQVVTRAPLRDRSTKDILGSFSFPPPDSPPSTPAKVAATNSSTSTAPAATGLLARTPTVRFKLPSSDKTRSNKSVDEQGIAVPGVTNADLPLNDRAPANLARAESNSSAYSYTTDSSGFALDVEFDVSETSSIKGHSANHSAASDGSDSYYSHYSHYSTDSQDDDDPVQHFQALTALAGKPNQIMHSATSSSSTSNHSTHLAYFDTGVTIMPDLSPPQQQASGEAPEKPRGLEAISESESTDGVLQDQKKGSTPPSAFNNTNPESVNHPNWTTVNPRLSFQLGTTLSVPPDYGKEANGSSYDKGGVNSHGGGADNGGTVLPEALSADVSAVQPILTIPAATSTTTVENSRLTELAPGRLPQENWGEPLAPSPFISDSPATAGSQPVSTAPLASGALQPIVDGEAAKPLLLPAGTFESLSAPEKSASEVGVGDPHLNWDSGSGQRDQVSPSRTEDDEMATRTAYMHRPPSSLNGYGSSPSAPRKDSSSPKPVHPNHSHNQTPASNHNTCPSPPPPPPQRNGSISRRSYGDSLRPHSQSPARPSSRPSSRNSTRSQQRSPSPPRPISTANTIRIHTPSPVKMSPSESNNTSHSRAESGSTSSAQSHISQRSYSQQSQQSHQFSQLSGYSGVSEASTGASQSQYQASLSNGYYGGLASVAGSSSAVFEERPSGLRDRSISADAINRGSLNQDKELPRMPSLSGLSLGVTGVRGSNASGRGSPVSVSSRRPSPNHSLSNGASGSPTLNQGATSLGGNRALQMHLQSVGGGADAISNGAGVQGPIASGVNDGSPNTRKTQFVVVNGDPGPADPKLNSNSKADSDTVNGSGPVGLGIRASGEGSEPPQRGAFNSPSAAPMGSSATQGSRTSTDSSRKSPPSPPVTRISRPGPSPPTGSPRAHIARMSASSTRSPPSSLGGHGSNRPLPPPLGAIRAKPSTASLVPSLRPSLAPSLVPSAGEEPDAFHVRSTYAQLEMFGVKGDGWVEGVERTRAARTRVASVMVSATVSPNYSPEASTSEGQASPPTQVPHRTKSQVLADDAIADADEKKRDLHPRELELLSNLDRYGFFNVQTHDRFVEMPSAPLAKALMTGFSASASASASAASSPKQQPTSAFAQASANGQQGGQLPPAVRFLPRVPPPQVNPKEADRINKWNKMLVPHKRDEGGNVQAWRIRPSKVGKVRSRVYKGVPDRWRAAVWEVLMCAFEHGQSGGGGRAAVGKDGLADVAKLTASQEAASAGVHQVERSAVQYRENVEKPSSYDVQIDLDVPRTISGHVMFRTRYGAGQRSLFHVLHAFSLICPTCGYVQGMGPITATLLSYLPPSLSYLALVRLHTAYNMHTIFSPGFPGLLEAIYVQEQLMKSYMPAVYKSFESNGVSGTAYATKWYITLFSGVVPWQVMLRVWDVFWLEGPDVFVGVACSILWVFKEQITSPHANFETILSLLSSCFVPENEDAFMNWIERMLGDAKVRRNMTAWRREWKELVRTGKDGQALL